MRPESHEHHILLNGVTPKCDICHNKLDPTEKIVALAGDKSTTFLHKGFLDPFGTETWEQQRQHKVLIDEKWRLCRVEEYVCHAFHGFQVRRHGCAFHEGCLQVFMRNYNPEQRPGEMLDRLWQACVWARVPWTGVRVPELGLWPATRSSWTCLGVFLEYANKCGLGWLGSLPEPVLVEIMELVPRDGDFWKYVVAIDMASRLAAEPAQPLRTLPLSWLVSWEWGQAPVLASGEEAERLPSVIRLTVDIGGISKFERLEKTPAFTRERYDNKAFVIEEERKLGVAVVHVKNGRLQLAVLNDIPEPELSVWDTPTPPDLSRCLVQPVKEHSGTRYHTIDLKSATGITLFQRGSWVLGIHAHSKTRLCALETLDMMSDIHERDKRYIHWLYIPLPPRDTVLGCGPLVDRNTRKAPSNRINLMFQTLCSGDFTACRFKPNWHDPTYNETENNNYAFLLADPGIPPTTLIYSNGPSRHSRGISVIAPYSHPPTPNPPTQKSITVLAAPPHYPSPEKYQFWEHSDAQLQNVHRACVYYHPNPPTITTTDDVTMRTHPGQTRGLLLTYHNGAQRALGECRIGVDPSQTFENPESLWFAYTNAGQYPVGVKMWFGTDEGRQVPPEDEEGPGGETERWFRYEMKGRLEFWFSWTEARVEVEGGEMVKEGEGWERAEGGEEVTG